MSVQQGESEYVSREEASSILGVSVRTIDRYIEDGKLKAVAPVVRSRNKPRVLILRSSVNNLKGQVVEISKKK